MANKSRPVAAVIAHSLRTCTTMRYKRGSTGDTMCKARTTAIVPSFQSTANLVPLTAVATDFAGKWLDVVVQSA